MSAAKISEAVVLMAGSGSRLRASGAVLPKALIPILGRPLFSYALDALRAVGISTLHVVVGNESATLLAGLEPLIPAEMRLHAIHNPDWEKQNGVSLLCAAPHLTAPFLLLMGDHLFEPQLLEMFVRQADLAVLNLAVDRKIDSIFDLDDAMKVQTQAGRIVAIGKALARYDAIDTGIFVCPLAIFSFLRRACREGDCSLADGVRLMAAEGQALVFDIGAAWWQDVDDNGMLGEAESEAAARLTSALRASQCLEREERADRCDRA